MTDATELLASPMGVDAAILLVDDIESNLIALEAVLGPLGLRLVRAVSGEDALRQVLRQSFALILLDVMMPGMDGLATAAMIRQRERSRETPIIFLTSLDRTHAEMMNGYSHGAADYLIKPYAPDILRAKVRVFVELFRSREDAKREGAARREAEARGSVYRFVAETIPQQVWTATPDGALDYVNPVVERYFGESAATILGAGWLGFLHPDDVAPCVARWMAALATGALYEIEFRLRRHDGSYRWHLGRAVAERGGDGQVLQWFGTNTDVDDYKAMEAELRRQQAALRAGEERLRLALEAGRMGDWEWDVATGVVRWSPMLERMHGLAVGSFEGTFEAFQRDIHPDDRARVLATIRASVEELAPHALTYRIVRADGSIRWLEARGSTMRDEAGQAHRLVGVCSDVTERAAAAAVAASGG